MQNRDRNSAVFWVLFGLFVMYASYKLGLTSELGQQQKTFSPGPGLMPFACGAFMVLISLYLFLQKMFDRKFKRILIVPEEWPMFSNPLKIGIVLTALLGYAIFLVKLGYLLTTLITLIILFRCMQARWFVTVTISLVASVGTYVIFSKLGVLLPEGIIGFGLGMR